MVQKDSFSWIVVGAGPGGVAVLGNLLSNGVDEKDVIWVDPTFTSGNLNDVREVPSNTKVQLFLKFFTACPYLNERVQEIDRDDPNANPFKAMRDIQQDIGCHLSYASDAIVAVTQSILKRIEHAKAKVESISRDQNKWSVKLSDGKSFSTDNVAFCTGSVARNLDLHKKYSNVKCIDLQDTFSPTKLSNLVGPDDTVAVLGTSHSGVLVLRNLCSILPDDHGIKVKAVKCVSKKPLLYAEYMEGWIKNDNTGLKLTAADWARQHYDGEVGHPLLQKITLGKTEEDTYKVVFPECTKIVYAVGYDRVKLPTITLNGEECQNISYNGKNGQITSNNNPVQGLYGFGIAFPELKKYPNGAEEWAVGMWKFMDYGQRVIPSWTKTSSNL